MQLYIGTKLIRAKEMTRAEYNVLRGWTLPEDENGDDLGYLVEYLDGGQANHADFAGYISWSPKEQFENAYLEVPALDDHKPYQVRLLAEKAQLQDKIDKGRAYLMTIDKTEQTALDLIDQLEAMQVYSEKLAVRISKLV